MDTLKIIFRFVYFILEINVLLGFGQLDKEVMFDKLVEIIDTDILLVTDKMHKNVVFQPPIGSSLEDIFRSRLDLFIGVPKELLMTGLDLDDGDLTTVNQLFLSCSSNTTRVNNSLSSAVPMAVESVSTECHTTESSRQNDTNTTATLDNVAVTVALLQTNITTTATVRRTSSIPSTTAQSLAFVNPIKRLSGVGIDGRLADGRDRKSTATTTRFDVSSTAAVRLQKSEIVRWTVSPKRTY